VRNPFIRQPEQPFLSPLGRQRRFPAVAAPLVLTVCGGVALVVAFSTLFGLQLRGGGSASTAIEEISGAPVETALPAIAAQAPVSVAVDRAEEEPALVTALPEEDVSEQGEPVLEPILPRVEVSGEVLTLSGNPPDPDPTAAIQPALPAEISALVPAPRPAPPAVQAAAVEARTPARNDAGNTPASATGLRSAVVNQAVNMRAAPNKGGQVVMVVPGGAAIDAETDCGWCEIRYQGRTGFIYKSFVNYR
jgi:hypothetical protein